jgi:hypothetical protein
MARSGVGRGEHHNAADAALDFLGNCDAWVVCGCILTRKPRKKLPTETVLPAAPDEYQPGFFSLEEERGANWKGGGRTAPFIKEAKPSL